MPALLLSPRLESPPFNDLHRSGDAAGRRRAPRWPLHLWQAASAGAQGGLLLCVPWFVDGRNRWGWLWWIGGAAGGSTRVLLWIFRAMAAAPVVLSLLAWRQIYRMRQHKASHRLSRFAYRMAVSAQRLHVAACVVAVVNAAVFVGLLFPLLCGDGASMYADLDWQSIGPAIYVSHPAIVALHIGNSVLLANLHSRQRDWARFAEQFDQLSQSLGKL